MSAVSLVIRASEPLGLDRVNRQKPAITDKRGSSSACSTEFRQKGSITCCQEASAR